MKNNNKGSILLIAILVSGVALAVGIGVYNRTYKELLFGSFWKQTQIAFSAADSGIECILYWQFHPAAAASCFGAVVSGWVPGDLIPSPGIDMNVPSGGCVNIKIYLDGTATTTEVRGFNTCDTTNPRRVERGLKVSI